MWATTEERDEQFRSATLERRPADPGDVRFEITALEEPEMGATHRVLIIDDRGEVIEDHITDLPYEMVEAHREAQSRREEADRLGVHPLEIEFAPFGPAWQREQDERRGGRV